MVLNKWAVVNKSAPPPRHLRPLARSLLHHSKLLPSSYRVPFIIRPFVRDRHLNELQHIENRGLYKEELSIERARFPNFQSTFVIQTDGSINEREMEITLPPIVILFHDRLTMHRQRQLALAKIGQLKPTHSWEASESSTSTEKNTSGDEEEEDPFSDAEDEDGNSSPSSPTARGRRMVCNALEFPYCVPRMLRVRTPTLDPLSAKWMVGKEAH